MPNQRIAVAWQLANAYHARSAEHYEAKAARRWKLSGYLAANAARTWDNLLATLRALSAEDRVMVAEQAAKPDTQRRKAMLEALRQANAPGAPPRPATPAPGPEPVPPVEGQSTPAARAAFAF